MADQTIRIAAEHVPEARRALMHIYAGIADALHGAAAEMAIRSGDQDATRGHRVELADAGDALDQIGWEFIAAIDDVELTAHPELLTDVIVQMIHSTLEHLETALDLDRGATDQDGSALTTLIGDLLVEFDLYEQVQGL
jgi:hypothetical protein